jgi:phosphohistidine phosphatase
MELYILRHGIAEEVSDTGADRDRVLTEEGIEKTKMAGKALRKLDIEFDAIFTSPFARARQTAEIVAAELDCEKLLQNLDALSSGTPVMTTLAGLSKAAGKNASVLIVGHEPMLSELISLLLSGSSGLSITMKKGGLCKLTCVRPEPAAARLDWLFTAKHLSRMA